MSFLRANGEGTEYRKKKSIKQSQHKLFNNWKVQLGPGHRIPELTAFDSSVIVIKYC